MKIFVYEHICGGGMAGREFPPSLLREGRAMWAAVLDDFSRIPDVEVVTTVDERLKPRAAGRVGFVPVNASNVLEEFGRCARDCDFTLLIAPESECCLYDAAREVMKYGGLLGPTVIGVGGASQKQVYDAELGSKGVPTPGTWAARKGRGKFPCVAKPYMGCGSIAVMLARNQAELDTWPALAAAEGVREMILVTPFVPGQAASVAVLCGPRGAVPLLPATQDLSTDGRFRYLGGRMPLPEPLAGRATKLALAAVNAIPGLQGYVGVDLVLGDTADDDVVIEINPRLTTSYVGLRALSRTNLAEQMINAVAGLPVQLDWKPGSVRFTPDGSVEISEPRA